MATPCTIHVRTGLTQFVRRAPLALLAGVVTSCGEKLPLPTPPPGHCNPAVTSVRIVPDHAELLPGQSFNYTAAVIGTACVTDFRATWRSSDTTVVTVSATGNVTARATGEATITALSTFDTLQRGTSTVKVR
jgi:hypothetical protein